MVVVVAKPDDASEEFVRVSAKETASLTRRVGAANVPCGEAAISPRCARRMND